jgi:hypothetical protein
MTSKSNENLNSVLEQGRIIRGCVGLLMVRGEVRVTSILSMISVVYSIYIFTIYFTCTWVTSPYFDMSFTNGITKEG